MNLLVVLAVAIVFGLLRFRRANLLVWAIAWWVGIYVLLRFGFTAPIPASVVALYMGIVSGAILAYVSSSEAPRGSLPSARPVHDGQAMHRAPRRNGRRHPALAAANVYVQMNVPLEPPLFSRSIPVPNRDHGSRQGSISTPRRIRANSRRRIRESSANTSRTGARSTIGTASSATATT